MRPERDWPCRMRDGARGWPRRWPSAADRPDGHSEAEAQSPLKVRVGVSRDVVLIGFPFLPLLFL